MLKDGDNLIRHIKYEAEKQAIWEQAMKELVLYCNKSKALAGDYCFEIKVTEVSKN